MVGWMAGVLALQAYRHVLWLRACPRLLLTPYPPTCILLQRPHRQCHDMRCHRLCGGAGAPCGAWAVGRVSGERVLLCTQGCYGFPLSARQAAACLLPHSWPTCAALPCRYECTVCTTGASSTCTVAPQCAANADGTCQCTLSGLEPATAISLTCVAIKTDGTESPGSSTTNTTTDLAP